MRYDDATRLLYGLAPRGVKLGLSRVERALAMRGHPQRAYPSIIVAGTNGKGSVCAMLASVLHASGKRVGLYTSPHLHQIVERFRIDGKPISKAEFARRVTELAPFFADKKTPPLTFFEATTLLAFEVFRDHEVDVAVLEVGLGGRLDATNVVSPLVSVVTHVALDHQDRLGPTLRHIAREKAGIIQRGVPVVVGPQDPEARAVLVSTAKAKRAPLIEAEEREDPPFAPPLPGDFQHDNLKVVLATLDVLNTRGFSLKPPQIKRGLSRVSWPGRLELIEGAPDVLLDAAHNPDACMRLSAHLLELRTRYPKRVLLFGGMRDKDLALMLAILRPHVQHLVFATPDTPRAEQASVLSERFYGEAIDDPLKALKRAQKLAGKKGLVVAAGSIFLMAPVRAALLGLPSDPPIAM